MASKTQETCYQQSGDSVTTKARDITGMPVMKVRCPTCPFHERHQGEAQTAAMVRQRVLTDASQICHHPRLKGRKETHLCRGARDFQLMVFYRLGAIEAQTDAAWSKAWEVIESKTSTPAH